MRRRRYLRGAGLAGIAGTAGCLGVFETRPARVPPVPDDRPDAVYYPSHVESMELVGTRTVGDYVVGVTYSLPHRFWTVTGDERSRVSIEDADSVHLMATVWDGETGTVLPEAGTSVEISRDGSLVSEEVIYPMLSQPMGLHYGGNFGLEGEGRYEVRVQVGPLDVERTGAFDGRFADGETATVEFPFSESALEALSVERLEDRAGTEGAVEPMEMAAIPYGQAPKRSALPGRTLGGPRSGDATIETAVLPKPPTGVDGDGPYLAVSPRTPYNRSPLPAAVLEASIRRGDGEVFAGELARRLDPQLGYHYGAAVPDLADGDAVQLEVTTPPQMARHEGYETAFMSFSPVTLTARLPTADGQ